MIEGPQNNALQLTRGASEASGLRRTHRCLVPLAAERECSTGSPVTACSDAKEQRPLEPLAGLMARWIGLTFHQRLGSKHRLSTQRGFSPGPRRRSRVPHRRAPSLLLSSPASAWFRTTDQTAVLRGACQVSCISSSPSASSMFSSPVNGSFRSCPKVARRVSVNNVMKLVPVAAQHPPPCRSSLLRMAIGSPRQRPARNNRLQNKGLERTRSTRIAAGPRRSTQC